MYPNETFDIPRYFTEGYKNENGEFFSEIKKNRTCEKTSDVENEAMVQILVSTNEIVSANVVPEPI